MNLDHNAGGRLRAEVAEAVAAVLRADLANPSSVHAAGRRARGIVEEARDAVAALVGARPSEVVFTSGGTEANATAIAGALATGAHAVSTAIEHVSVLRSLESCCRAGASTTLVATDRDGLVDPGSVAAALRSETTLVSVGWANGEIGTVQPVGQIVSAVRAARSSREPAVLVHSDAVQAVATIDVDFAASGVDLLALSGHKLGAPTGVGALVVRTGTAPVPLLLGGGQERGRRAGTENVPGIAGFGEAARLALAERERWARRAVALREVLWSRLASTVEPVVRLGRGDGLAATLAVAFPGLRGDALVVALDLEGVAASAGSACAAGAAEPSHVLRAIGLEDDVARGAVRLSFGPSFGESDVAPAVAAIARVVARARSAGRPRSEAHRAA